ncbi:hypothetical protein L7F22_043720 [Adiantum nelumboides]|nr:hypothetical protein [Adiantum nelumboides]
MLSSTRAILARQIVQRYNGRRGILPSVFLSAVHGSLALSYPQNQGWIRSDYGNAGFHSTIRFNEKTKSKRLTLKRAKDSRIRRRQKELAGRLNKAIEEQTKKAMNAQEKASSQTVGKNEGENSQSTSVWSKIVSAVMNGSGYGKQQGDEPKSKKERIKSKNEVRREEELKKSDLEYLLKMKPVNGKEMQKLKYLWSDIKIPESKKAKTNQQSESSDLKELHKSQESRQSKEFEHSTQSNDTNQSVQSTEKQPPKFVRDANEKNYRPTILLRGDEIEKARVVRPNDKAMEVGDRDIGDYLPFEHIPLAGSPQYDQWHEKTKWTTPIGGILSSEDVGIEEVEPLRKMDVATLSHGLDRVLFNPGIHWLRDERSGIYNFEPEIRNLYDVDLFDYSALPPYLTSSIDDELAKLTQKHAKRYSGSTSSLTALLSHIYFCVSSWKHPPLTGFTEGFQHLPKGFSFGATLPAAIILRRFEDEALDGSQAKSVRYAVDNDKTGSGSENNNYVLTQLGKSVEKLLTSDTEEYEKYLRVNSHKLSEEEKTKKEAYYYSMSDKFMMRSQLDCSDDRLPRKTFDLKTRAVIAVRQDRANWVESSGYMIRHNTGVQESFERELWDMSRGALLKYFFQARIGNMDGIMVAYHSTSTMFGFQYLSREELARRIFSSEEMAEQAFRLSLGMLEKILDAASSYYPNDTLRITMDAQNDPLGREESHLLVFVTPESVSEEVETNEGKNILGNSKTILLEVHVDRYLSGALVHGPVNFSQPKGYAIDVSREDEIARRERSELPPLEWKVEYSITPRSDLSQEETETKLQRVRKRQTNLAALLLPNVEALNERERERELQLSKNPEALEKFLEDRRTGKAPGMPPAPGQVVLGVTNENSLQDTEALKTLGEQEVGEESKNDTTDDGKIHLASIDNGDDLTARADIPERPIEQDKGTQQKWVRQTKVVKRLRRLARLGQQDKDEREKTDKLEMYERRG